MNLRRLAALCCLTLVAACTPTNTTVRFTGNREAVMVQNAEHPKVGSKLETLIGTRKKVFFYVTRGASVTSFNSSVDPVIGRKKSIADLLIDQHPVRLFILQLQQPLAIIGSPTMQNKAAICANPGIANIVGDGTTQIVGVGRGSWIAAFSHERNVYFRPVDPDLVMIVDVDGLDAPRAADFVLRMGSLTFEHGR